MENKDRSAENYNSIATPVERLERYQPCKSEGDPLPEWIEYPVQLVGHADSYVDSVQRLVTLETKPFAYTSESDTAPQKKVLQIVKELQKQSLEQIMEVSEIEAEDSVDSEYSDEQDSSSSSEDNRAKPTCKKVLTARIKSNKFLQKKKVSESKSTDSDFSRSDENNVSKSTRIALNEFQSLPQLQKRAGKKKEEKKTILKPRSTDSNSSRSDKSKGSKLSKTTALEESVWRFPNISKVTSDSSENFEQNAVATISKKSRNPALPLASETFDVSDNRQGTAAVDNLFEGAYVVQESGELAKLTDKQKSTSNTDLNQLDCIQELLKNKIDAVNHLLKSSNFDKSLSKASDTVLRAGKNYTEDTLLILSTLKGLSTDIKENTNAINNLCAAIRYSKVSTVTNSKPKPLVLETDFDLPFKTLKDFQTFDNRLKDAKYREHCIDSLLFYVDQDNHVTKSVTNILKKFVGREVCMNFTAVKQIGEKKVFKETKFCNVMFEVITNHHKDIKGEVITEKYFYHCIGQTIANAKDWDGARLDRAKKEKAKREEKAAKESA